MTTPNKALPDFGIYGLLPNGVHDCSMGMLRNVFATNPRRAQLYESLCDSIKLMRQAGLEGVLYVDGSYATDKELPGDVDVVLDTSGMSIEIQIKAICFQANNYDVMLSRGVQFFAMLPAMQNNFIHFFQYAGEKTGAVKKCSPKEPKGILCIKNWQTELTYDAP